jgi:gliding motility-associated-like protein
VRLFLTLLILFNFACLAQKETNNWYFGNKVGLDFSTDPPTALQNSAMNTREGCSVISDSLGNLLFYTNGVKVWDSSHQVMPNGLGLLGSKSSSQSALVVKKPFSNNLFYVFTTPSQAIRGFYYSIVDMSLNGGKGDLVQKNEQLWENKVTEKLTATLHNNGKDIWILIHEWESDLFLSFLLTQDGVSVVPVESETGKIHKGGTFANPNINAAGQMKIRPQGDLGALAVDSVVQVFKFDNLFGSVNVISNLYDYFHDPTGIEFSSSGGKLYMTDWASIDEVIQFDLSNLNSFDLVNTSRVINSNLSVTIRPYHLQLANNDKVYISYWYSDTIAVINNPEENGLACNLTFQDNYYGQGRNSLIGLPNFLSSYFYIPTFEFKNTCLGDSTMLYIGDTLQADSVLWNFNDISTGIFNESKIDSTYHVFSNEGAFNVTLTVYLNGNQYETIRKIGIIPPLEFNLGNDTIVCADDTLSIEPFLGGSYYLWNDSSNYRLYEVIYPDTLIWLEATDLCGNIFRDSINIDYKPLIEFDIADTSLCPNDSLAFDVYYDNATYNWSNGTVDSVLWVYFDSISIENLFVVTVTGECNTLIDSVTINKNEYYSFDYWDTYTMCNDDSLMLSTPYSEEDHLWQNGSTNPFFKIYDAGIYYVDVNTPCGIFSDTLEVFLDSIIEPFSYFDTTLCESIVFDFCSDNEDELWSNGDSCFTSINDTGVYYLTKTTSYCALIDSINVINEPEMQLTNDTVVCQNEIVVLIDKSNYGNYNWSNSSNENYIEVIESGIYVVSREGYCKVLLDSVNVAFINCDLWAPIIFTPNNDDINDLFFVKGIELDDVSLTVFNRWGNKVYTNDHYNNDWTGNDLNGNKLTEGIYYFIVSSSMWGDRLITGYVHLVR